MPYACIDVGSNTTRLLVAHVRGGRVEPIETRREFTRIGRELAVGDRIPVGKIEEAGCVVEEQLRLARDLGASEVTVVATAAIRQAANGSDLVDALAERSGLDVAVLSSRDEARLAFLGATRAMEMGSGPTAVLDVGGGSTEVAVGPAGGALEWFHSAPVGSGLLAEACVRSDPARPEELEAVRARVASALGGLAVPPVEHAVAVGGSAGSLRRLVGDELSHEALDRALRVLAEGSAEEVAGRFGLHPERVRLLPAGVVIVDELARRVGAPVTAGRGGVREGAILELAGADG